MVFDVAVWRAWSSRGLPPLLPVVGYVEAPDALTAIKRVMRFYGWRSAGHAAAHAVDKSVVYRADNIRLTPAEVGDGAYGKP